MILNSKHNLVVFAIIAVLLAVAGSARAQTSANVSVDASSSLGTIPPDGIGVNALPYDACLTDCAVRHLLTKMGTRAMRFPSGTADEYHWESGGTLITSEGGAPTACADSFDSFMAIANVQHATPIVPVNYGENETATGGGDPNEAAAWVAYCVTKGYNVKYWEIGNEVWDNGEYPGAAGEIDLHADKSPTAYGQNCLAYISAMRAQDSDIKIGVTLAWPGAYPDGIAPDWNSNVLMQCGSQIDFVILHYYPEPIAAPSDSDLLSSAARVQAAVAEVRALINLYCGKNAPNVQILMTETNCGGQSKQCVNLTDGLFLADDVQACLESGISSVDVFSLHDGMLVNWLDGYPYVGGDVDPSLYGTNTFVDDGLLSDDMWSGSLNGNLISEPKNDTPFASYYGVQMASYLGGPGDAMVNSSTDQPMIATHAVKKANGDIALMLINKDPNNTCSTSININGYSTPWTAPCTTYFFGESNAATLPCLPITQANITAGSCFTASLPPYSMTTFILTPPVSSPTLAASITSAPLVIAINSTTTISVSVADSGAPLSNATASINIYDNNHILVASNSWTGQSWSSGGTNSYSYTWAAPSSTGTYFVSIGVADSSGDVQYYWGNNLASIMVTATGAVPNAPKFTETATVSPSTVTQGQSAQVTVSFEDIGAAVSAGTAICQSYNGQLNYQNWANQSWIYGQTRSFEFTWSSASDPPGTYSLEGGVLQAFSGAQYDGYDGAIAKITVEPPSFSATGTASPSTPTTNSSVNISAAIAATGGAFANGTAQISVWDANGNLCGNYTVPGQSWSPNQINNYSFAWETPSTTGTYNVAVGVSDSAGLYLWQNVATINVDAEPPSFSATGTASPTTLPVDATSNMTASITDTGGALTNGTAQISIWNANGNLCGNYTVADQSWSPNQTNNYSYVWPTPSATGNYIVAVGVSDSAGLYLWQNVATVTVNGN